jgi:protein-S-isoprenylcysteine O-methyltransferase Ste14
VNKGETHKPRWEATRKDIIVSSIMGVLAVAQIVWCFLFYNWAGLDIVLYGGWFVLAVSIILCFLSAYELKKWGAEESHMATTVLVDRGLYAVVRHPMYVSWMLFLFALMLISQHWLSPVYGVPVVGSVYLDMRKEEQSNICKFGDDYRGYMQVVPRMNFVAGLVRLLRGKRGE